MAHSIPIGETEPLELARSAEGGVAASQASKLAARLAIPVGEFAKLIGIPGRTLHRRLKDRKPLSIDDGAKILRVQRLIAIADEVFESPVPTKNWFSKPLRVLGGRSPLTMCTTEFGAREVEDTLGRIDHGVFS